MIIEEMVSNCIKLKLEHNAGRRGISKYQRAHHPFPNGPSVFNHTALGTTNFHPLLTIKIIASNNRSQINLLCKSSQVIPHPRPIPQLLPPSWCILLCIKVCWLLVQHEDVSMRCTRWWGCWSNVAGYEWRCCYQLGCAVCGWPWLQVWLDPVGVG